MLNSERTNLAIWQAARITRTAQLSANGNVRSLRIARTKTSSRTVLASANPSAQVIAASSNSLTARRYSVSPGMFYTSRATTAVVGSERFSAKAAANKNSPRRSNGTSEGLPSAKSKEPPNSGGSYFVMAKGQGILVGQFASLNPRNGISGGIVGAEQIEKLKSNKAVREGLETLNKKLHASNLNDNTVSDFFAGTRYTDKVIKQMSKSADPFHSFPDSVIAFQTDGKITKLIGGDGKERHKLSIPGEYLNRKGNFVFIRELNGSINHRQFEKD